MPLRLMLASLFLACSLALPAQSPANPWQMETSGTTASLRGIHAVGGGVAWASGTNGTVLRTEDSGYMWQSCAMPPGAEKLDFRAVWAWDANTAVVMSSGPGDQSRLYKTTDGCSHWKLVFTNPDQDGFWDAMVFQTRMKGLVLGDPVRGRFTFLTTDDGGATWKRSEAEGLEAAAGEGAFAASNSALLGGTREARIFGAAGALVYEQSFVGRVDFGAPGTTKPLRMAERWEQRPVPMAHTGTAAGIFSLGYHTADASGYGFTVVAVGGDYTKPDDREGTAARSEDAKQWLASSAPPGGYRSAVAWDPDHKFWITVGPNGSDLSRDDGRTWQPIEHAAANMPKGGEWNALSLPWVVGPNGRIAKLNAEALPKAPAPAK